MPAPARSQGRTGLGRLPVVSPTTFRRAAIASLVMSVLIVVTGAAVRLTGSGLGCPDWPSCYRHRLTAQLSYHPAIEFGNRLVTVVFTIVVVATLLAAIRRVPFRRDLVWLSGGLVGGVLAQAVLGGIVVYTKLNPYLVMTHLLLSMVVIVVAVVLLRRCTRDYRAGAGTDLVPRPIRLLARAVVGLTFVVVAAGTATTGAGPHAGGSQGQLVAKRLPVSLRDMAELHSSLALLLVGAVIGLAVALHTLAVPEQVRRAARVLTALLVAQGVIGYTQYFSHLPALLVEVHVIGATALVVGVTQLLLALTHHPAEQPSETRDPSAPTAGPDGDGDARGTDGDPGDRAVATASVGPDAPTSPGSVPAHQPRSGRAPVPG
jgi:cytochrome c oxidase assembly protein subunit 15